MPITNVAGGETLLIEKWLRGDESALQSLIGRYQKLIFNLVLYLGRCDHDTAYQITASIFAQGIGLLTEKGNDGDLLKKIIRIAAEKCRALPSEFSFDTSDFAAFSPAKKAQLSVAKEALFRISFEHRLSLLLRDQMNLPYAMIAETLALNEAAVRANVVQARIQLGDKLQEILKRARGES